jgi:hypothetical protein
LLGRVVDNVDSSSSDDVGSLSESVEPSSESMKSSSDVQIPRRRPRIGNESQIEVRLVSIDWRVPHQI